MCADDAIYTGHVREYHYGWPGGRITGLVGQDAYEGRVHYEMHYKLYVVKGYTGPRIHGIPVR